MVFYVAKGLQLAGLGGLALALYFGMTDSMGREVRVALLSVVAFYAGRRLEG